MSLYFVLFDIISIGEITSQHFTSQRKELTLEKK